MLSEEQINIRLKKQKLQLRNADSTLTIVQVTFFPLQI